MTFTRTSIYKKELEHEGRIKYDRIGKLKANARIL